MSEKRRLLGMTLDELKGVASEACFVGEKLRSGSRASFRFDEVGGRDN